MELTWQDAVLTVVSLAFIVALVPSIVQRQTAPLSSCVLTATGLLVIGAVDFTFRPVILFAASTTLITSAMWWTCAVIAWRQRNAAWPIDSEFIPCARGCGTVTTADVVADPRGPWEQVTSSARHKVCPPAGRFEP